MGKILVQNGLYIVGLTDRVPEGNPIVVKLSGKIFCNGGESYYKQLSVE